FYPARVAPRDEDGRQGFGNALEFKGPLTSDWHRPIAASEQIRAHQDLAGSGGSRDAGGSSDGRAEVVVVAGGGLAGVESDADHRSEAVVGAVASERPLDRGCAGDAIVGVTESHEEPITSVFHLLAPPSGE